MKVQMSICAYVTPYHQHQTNQNVPGAPGGKIRLLGMRSKSELPALLMPCLLLCFGGAGGGESVAEVADGLLGRFGGNGRGWG